jgi:serine/threonine protein kinase
MPMAMTGDDYVIGAVMGEGLVGPRFAGRYRPSGHPVALEEIPHELLTRPDFVERLAISGRRAAGLSSAHVVQVYDLVRISHRLYMVSELCRGRSLAALLSTGSLPLASALAVAEAVLQGLEDIHGAGLVHGDVRPECVLVTASGEVRLAELGLAAVLAADSERQGHPAVPPPEGGGPAPAADVHAAGALLHRMLSGVAPGGAQWAGQARLSALVSRATAPLPEERFASAAAAREELQRVATDLLGPEWRGESDLAARVARPLGPPAPRAPRGSVPPSVEAVAPAGPEAAAPGEAVAESVAATAMAMRPASLPPPPPLSPTAARNPGPAAAAGPPAASFTEAPASTGARSGRDAWPTRASPRSAAPPPWGARRRRRRAALAAVVAVVLVAAAVAAVVELRPLPASTAGSGALSVGAPVTLSVQPGTTAGCNATFTFTATGPLSGSGTLVYRWEESEGGLPATYQQYSVRVSNDASFRFTTQLSYSGSATITTAVTFLVLSPQARSATRTVRYVCAHAPGA